MAIYLVFLAIALSFSILTWQKGRPQGWIFPSDLFFLACLLSTGTVPFLNLYAFSPETEILAFSDEIVQRALVALTIMYVCLGLVWMLRTPIVVSTLLPLSFYESGSRQKAWRNVHRTLIAGALLFVVLSLTPLLYPPYLQFKLQVFRFLSGSIAASDYQLARRVTFVDDDVIGGFIGRLRFSVFPILFLSGVLVSFAVWGWLISISVAVVLFVLGPASMSKAPIVVYAAYFVVAMGLMKNYQAPFKARNFFIILCISLPSLMAILTCIYFLQYRETFVSLASIPEALSLAYFRVFTATYQGFLQHFMVYPRTAGFVGFAGISFVAAVFGIPVRSIDQEVSVFIFGPDGLLTSFPTMFAGGAYASFGYMGVAVFSLTIGAYIGLLDRMLIAIQNPYLRVIYISTISINVLFFAILQAPSAMVTYGCAVIPASIFIIDKVLRKRIVGNRPEFRPRNIIAAKSQNSTQ